MRDESCRQLESSGAAPDVSVSPVGQFCPDPPIVREAVGGSEDVRRRVDDEGTEADDESEIISVGGPLSIVCESEGVTFEEAVGRLALFQNRTMLLILLGYRFVSFQASQKSINLLLGCHTGQLFDPLS